MSRTTRSLPATLMVAASVALITAGCGAAAPSAPPAATAAPVPAAAVAAAPPSPTAAPASPSPSPNVGQALASDLQFIDSIVRSMHPDPFASTTEAAWNAKLDELRSSLPTAEPDVALVQLEGLIGLLGSHSWLAGPPGGSFPFVAHRFEEGFYITRAVDPTLVGSRIDAIDGTPVDVIESKLLPLIPADNASGKLDALGLSGVDPEADRRMGSPNMLHGLGIIADPSKASFSLTRPDGTTSVVDMTTVPGAPLNDQLGVTGGLNGDAPDAVAKRNDVVWTQVDDAHKAFLFSINDMHEEGVPEALTAMKAAFADGSANKVILDLRYARGGSSKAMAGLVSGLADDKQINRPGHLLVLMGREDVSASTTVIAQIQAQTKALLFGEATPARADNFLNPQWIDLPASGWQLVLPTFSWHTGDTRPAIEPDVAVPTTAKDFFAGKDATLEAALAYKS